MFISSCISMNVFIYRQLKLQLQYASVFIGSCEHFDPTVRRMEVQRKIFQLVTWTHTFHPLMCKYEKNVSMRLWWYISIWIGVKNHLMRPSNPLSHIWEVFASSAVSIIIFCDIFRFYSILRVIDEQLPFAAAEKRKQVEINKHDVLIGLYFTKQIKSGCVQLWCSFNPPNIHLDSSPGVRRSWTHVVLCVYQMFSMLSH